jgi:hypothetical protein
MTEENKLLKMTEPAHEFYAGFVNVQSTQYDLRISFGPWGKEPPVPIDTKIIMSWPLAKQFHEMLGKFIAQYEVTQGKIP